MLPSRSGILAEASNLSIFQLKGALSDLKQFLLIESPLKMMKNAFYFTSKALFVLKIFKFLFVLLKKLAT